MAEIRSHLPGTFYRRPSPEEPPFKDDGGTVAVGDVVGLVEVMKTFTEVKSEVAGTIKFVVENEEPVTAGQVIAEVS
ncbi:MAG: acetyl-CoA carboxylase [Devosia sp.]